MYIYIYIYNTHTYTDEGTQFRNISASNISEIYIARKLSIMAVNNCILEYVKKDKKPPRRFFFIWHRKLE